MDNLFDAKIPFDRHYCSANSVTEKKVGPSDLRVRPRVRLHLDPRFPML
jgi:hypothetical protein